MELTSCGKRFSSPTEWLRAEYLQRKEKNPNYSIRAFARRLKISAGSLAELLAAKRPLTGNMARRLADELCYSPQARESIVGMVQKHYASHQKIRAFTETIDSKYQRLEEDTFRLISEWYHLALLTLLETDDIEACPPAKMARRLGISTTEVRDALDRLERLNLVGREDGRWKSKGDIETTTDVPSAAVRKFHHQSLEKAIESLESLPVAERDVTAITIAMDPEKLKLAKELIQKFRRNLADILGEGRKKEVYQLNIQLIPLTRKDAAS